MLRGHFYSKYIKSWGGNLNMAIYTVKSLSSYHGLLLVPHPDKIEN
jgi:hypothetical protein